MNKAFLVPYVCGAGASLPGTELGPLFAYEKNLGADIRADWLFHPDEHWQTPYGEVFHAGLPPRGHPARLETVQWHINQLASNVAATIKDRGRAITVGGDHTLSAGSIAGARKALPPSARCGLVWVDAHSDIHTFDSSESKALHGMPLGTVMGLDQTMKIEGCAYPLLAPDNLIYAGLRSVDAGEIVNTGALGIAIPAIEDLRAAGVRATLRPQLDALAQRCDHIFLSIDLDAFATSLAPAVGSPVEDGFLYEEIVPLLIDLVRNHNVPLIDIVEFNPTLPGTDETYNLMVRILSDLHA